MKENQIFRLNENILFTARHPYVLVIWLIGFSEITHCIWQAWWLVIHKYVFIGEWKLWQLFSYDKANQSELQITKFTECLVDIIIVEEQGATLCRWWLQQWHLESLSDDAGCWFAVVSNKWRAMCWYVLYFAIFLCKVKGIYFKLGWQWQGVIIENI